MTLERNFVILRKESGNKKLDNKEEIIKDFIESFTILNKTTNIVVFLDFDTEHKKCNLENSLERELGIGRVFHLDSKSTDLLQLVDLLLATSVRGGKGLLNDKNYFSFAEKINKGKYLTKGELKSFLSSYLYRNDKNGKIKK